ncbi:hypothetical protein HAX54_042860, partial [Datura stramonium]|nr:hypothetical protein [Datura stramonium]
QDDNHRIRCGGILSAIAGPLQWKCDFCSGQQESVSGILEGLPHYSKHDMSRNLEQFSKSRKILLPK